MSAADEAVLEAGSVAGVRITERELRDWRSKGLIPKATVRSLGRGKGRSASYSEREIAHCVEAARRVSVTNSVTFAALWMFSDGYDMDDKAVRRHFGDVIDQLYNFIEKATGTRDTELQAEKLAATVLKASRPSRWVRMIRSTTTMALALFAAELAHDEAGEDEPPSRRSFQQDLLYGALLAAMEGTERVDWVLRYVAAIPLAAIKSQNPELVEDAEGFFDDFTDALDEFNLPRCAKR